MARTSFDSEQVDGKTPKEAFKKYVKAFFKKECHREEAMAAEIWDKLEGNGLWSAFNLLTAMESPWVIW